MSEQAANVLLPTGGAGGLALGAWALRRIGMPAERIGRRTVAFFLITSSVNFAAVVVAGLGLAAGVLPGEVALATALVPALLGVPRSRRCAALPRLVGGDRRARRRALARALTKAGTYVADGVRDAISLLGSGRPLVVGGAIAYMALDVLALAAVFAAFGGGAPSLGRLRPRLHRRPARRAGPAPGRDRRHRRRPDRRLRARSAPRSALAAAAVIAYRAFQLGVPALARPGGVRAAAPAARQRVARDALGAVRARRPDHGRGARARLLRLVRRRVAVGLPPAWRRRRRPRRPPRPRRRRRPRTRPRARPR